MKKSLVLAMALAMGVTASAYAANPFSDVPAGHWAYDAVDKLAAAGVIDGMGDGTFQGDKTMTRYEMAQIVAKAMAKGANVEKLAAEFADELDQLGVRVAKLEKKADNVTITGQIRFENQRISGDIDATGFYRLRTRLFVNGQINEDWAYHARIQNNQNFNTATGDNTVELNHAWVDGKLFGLKVSAGRQDITLADGNLYDDTMDAIKVSYGKNVKFTAYAAQATEIAQAGVASKWTKTGSNTGEWADAIPDSHAKAYGADVTAKIGAVDARVGYDQFNFENGTFFGTENTTDSDKVWNVGVAGDIGKLNLNLTYLHASNDVTYGANKVDPSKSGWIVGAQYGAVDNAQVGSWDVWAKYYKQGAGTFLDHTMNGAFGDFLEEGFKGYGVGVGYAFAKNITGYVEYYDLKGQESDLNEKTLFGRMQFCF